MYVLQGVRSFVLSEGVEEADAREPESGDGGGIGDSDVGVSTLRYLDKRASVQGASFLMHKARSFNCTRSQRRRQKAPIEARKNELQNYQHVKPPDEVDVVGPGVCLTTMSYLSQWIPGEPRLAPSQLDQRS